MATSQRGLRGAILAAAALSAVGALAQTRVEPSATSIFQRSAPPPDVKAIGAGAAHTCAIIEDGKVMCWGLNTDGQLGDRTLTARTKPALVRGVTGARQLALGAAFTCALLTTSNVMCWGRLPGMPQAAASVPGLSGVKQIAAGAGHICAIMSDDSVRCWGDNTFGQVGDGTTKPALAPVAVTGLTRVIDLALGWQHSCARVIGAAPKCWGSNTNGQLGNATVPVGPTTGSAIPVDVTGLVGVQVLALAGGGTHTCAIVSQGGTVRCWGANADGQLGDGSRTQSATPVVVTGLANAVKIAAGKTGACAVVGSGAQCWGWFGPPSSDAIPHRPTLTPTKVLEASSGTELLGVRDLAAGGGHLCARRPDGTVLCWGNNVEGELGAATATCGGARETFVCSRTAVAVAW